MVMPVISPIQFQHTIRITRLNLSFPNNVQTAFAGSTFPNYKQAFSSSCIERRAYNWTGLTQTEINLFTSFIKAFNNSWQPFTLTYNSVAEDLIVESDPHRWQG